MKISELQNLNRPLPVLPGVDRREGNPQKQAFERHMSGIDKGNYMEKLTELSVNISKQGEMVAKRCDILELKRYREMIAEYMGEAVRFAFEFKKQSTLDARGRHRMYALIKRINQKLEELTKQILEGEADNLAV
ncbi:MAG: YaaR family protein, partial [Oscillospiraceae bacterium]|nr:YaaR family protein [Oscillospiraceae bacterium]